MNKNIKLSMTIAALLLPLTTLPCVFTVTNDSQFHDIYLVSNPNIGQSVQRKTLDRMRGEDVVKVSKGIHRTHGKIGPTKWFWIYTKNAQTGTYDRHYKVAIRYCTDNPADNQITFQQIEARAMNMDRYIVENYQEMRLKGARPGKPQRYIETDRPGQFLSNEEIFPDTLP